MNTQEIVGIYYMFKNIIFKKKRKEEIKNEKIYGRSIYTKTSAHSK